MKITHHAVDRYRERIRAVPVDQARAEMMTCFNAAKERHRAGLKRRKHKRTFMVPTGCCIFVFEKGTMVTVLPRPVGQGEQK
jgi:hypothetical protein